MGKRRAVAVLASALGLALVAGACGSSTSGSSTGGGATGGGASGKAAGYVTGGTLTQLIPSDPGNLDPLMTVTGVTRGLDYYAYDPLINEEPNGTLVSGLATSWKQSGNTYRFTLRKGVTCSDGSTLTPATVAANINYLSDPAHKSPLLGLLVPPGAKATADPATSQLSITVAQPFPFFFEDLSQVGLVCAKGLADPSSLAEGTDGSGPYVLSQAVAGQQYTFTIRKGYAWGPGGATTATPGMPAKIVVKVVADPTTEANLVLGGGANLANVQGLASKPLSAAHLFQRSAVAPLGELWFNEGPGHATAAARVRQAVVQALDLSQIGQVLGQGQGTPATGMVTVAPKACPGNTVAGTIPSQDTAKAASLLGGRHLTLTLLYATDVGGDPASAFELAAQELRKVGIDLKLVGDTTTQLESVIFGTGNWDLVDVPIGVDTPNELVPFVSGPAAPQGENFSHIADAAYTALATKAAALPGTTGCTDWNNAEKQLFDALDVVPFENALEPDWGRGVTFSMVAGEIPPTSFRLVKA